MLAVCCIYTALHFLPNSQVCFKCVYVKGTGKNFVCIRRPFSKICHILASGFRYYFHKRSSFSFKKQRFFSGTAYTIDYTVYLHNMYLLQTW